MANVMVGDMSLLAHCSAFLDPFARLLGMDGVILMAFILGFPANEVVFPIIIMAYMAGGTLTDRAICRRAHPADGKRLDPCDRGMYHAVFPDALALLHHLHDDTQGNGKPQMDGGVLPHPYGRRDAPLFSGILRGEAVRRRLTWRK